MDREDWVFLVFMCLFCCAIGFILGAGSCVREWRKQAVEHNAARWETASDGSTTFVWDEEAEE